MQLIDYCDSRWSPFRGPTTTDWWCESLMPFEEEHLQNYQIDEGVKRIQKTARRYFASIGDTINKDPSPTPVNSQFLCHCPLQPIINDQIESVSHLLKCPLGHLRPYLANIICLGTGKWSVVFVLTRRMGLRLKNPRPWVLKVGVTTRALQGREQILKILYTNKKTTGNFDNHKYFLFYLCFELVIATW